MSTLSLRERFQSLTPRAQSSIKLLLFSVLVILLEVVLYWNFIFGDEYLIYIGVGSDSWAQSVPFFLNAADRLQELDFSDWNFSMFLGMATPARFNIEYCVSLFGREHVAIMMLVSQLLKVYFAGFFFYWLTVNLKMKYSTSVISGLCAAFCGRMMAIGCWTGYSMEVTLAFMLLWSLERFYQNRKKFIALPVTICLIAGAQAMYGLVLYSAIAFGYVVFRVIYSGTGRFSSVSKLLFGYLALYIAGVLLALPMTIPYLQSTLDSARVSGAFSSEGASDSSSTGIFAILSTPDILATEVLSLFTPIALGGMNHYTGSLSYLNIPYYYCGVITLIAVPFAFVHSSNREKLGLALLCTAAALYIFISPLRNLLNGFAVPATDFRMSSFFVSMALLIVGTYGLDKLLSRELKPKLSLLVISAVCLVCLLLAGIGMTVELHKRYIALAAVIIVVDTIILALLTKPKTAGQCQILIIMLVCVTAGELFCQSYRLVNDCPTVTKQEYATEYDSDFDDQLESVAKDDIDKYRVNYGSILLCRPLAFDYHGTQMYVGGVGMSKQFASFMASIENDYIEQLGYSRYAYGSNDMYLNTLLGAKFLIYQNNGEDNYYVPFGYTLANDQDADYLVYENEYALPLVYAYSADQTISVDNYMNIERDDRPKQMLETVVLDDNDASDRADSIPVDEQQIISSGDDSVSYGKAWSASFDAVDDDYLLVDMRLNAKSSESSNLEITTTFTNQNGERTTIPYLTAKGNEDIEIPVKNNSFDNVEVSINYTNNAEDATVTDICVSGTSSAYFNTLISAYSELSSSGISVENVNNSEVVCLANFDESKYVASTIPYDRNWHVYIDGTETDTFPVNIGFIGFEADEGNHYIEFVYDNRLKDIGIALAIATAIVLAAVAIRLHLKKH